MQRLPVRVSIHRVCLGLLAVLVIGLLSACVILHGQRITVFHDTARDSLLLLINYDGIHDSGDDDNGRGVDQIPKFLRNGEVLLLDWPWHYDPARLAGWTTRAESLAAENQKARVALARFTQENVKARVLGHYRDFENRIGAAQLVTISSAQQFIERINRAIDEALLHELEDSAEWPRSFERLRVAAAAGTRWVQLEGHSLVIRFPVHPREWAYGKFEILDNVIGASFRDKDPKSSHRLFQSLAAAPLSYQEEAGWVTIRLGEKSRPHTYRFSLREDYEPSLEEVITTYVPTNLDEVWTTGDGSNIDPALPKLLPPEERVRAWIRAAAEPGAAGVSARTLLREFGSRWNGDEGMPAAPAKAILAPETSEEALTEYLDAWRLWYKKMTYYPRTRM